VLGVAGEPRCVTGVILPAAPADVRLTFSEPVQVIGSGVRVVSPSGAHVERGPARVEGREVTMPVAARDKGTYVVSWRVVSGDTQPVRGSFVFSVGHATPLAAASGAGAAMTARVGFVTAVLARVLHFAGYALSFGVLALRAFVASHPGAAAPATWRLVRGGVAALIVAEPLALFAQSWTLGVASDPEVVADVLASRAGLVMGQRLGVALLLWAMLTVLRRGSKPATTLALWLGLGLALIDGQAAHAMTTRPLALGLAVNAIHVAAMGTWLGALAALVAAGRGATGATDPRGLAVGARRLALGCLFALVASGAVMTLQHVPRIADVMSTTYGRVLGVKLVILVLALALAARARRAVRAERTRWWIRAAAAFLAVLVCAGVLVSLRPPA
jgi:copper transport protein